MLPSCFFCPIAALDFSPQSVTTVRLLPPSSFVRLALEQNQLRSFLLALLFFGQNQLQSFLLALLFFGQNQLQYLKELVFFAVRTGLEPATPGVTGRYSNQLNYRTIVLAMFEPMEGIEPTTPRLQITCSGQLSYIGNFKNRSGFLAPFGKGLQRYTFL